MINIAHLKLINGTNFDDQDVHHVLAVLSQRLCVDLLLAGEAIELAERSVAKHMRLLTGMSSDHQAFYTRSPSEPVLALGAADILYREAGRWAPVLKTFCKRLCEGGLVDEGLLGGFAARTLLLI